MDESQKSLGPRLDRIEAHLAELRKRMARVEEAQEALKRDKAVTHLTPPPLPSSPFTTPIHIPEQPAPSAPARQPAPATSFIKAPSAHTPAQHVASPISKPPATSEPAKQPTPATPFIQAPSAPSAPAEQPALVSPSPQAPPAEIPESQIEETISDLLVLDAFPDSPASTAPPAPPIHFIEEPVPAPGAAPSSKEESDIAKLDKSIQTILQGRRDQGGGQEEKEWVEGAEMAGDSTPPKSAAPSAPLTAFAYPPPIPEAAPSFDFKEFMRKLNLLPPTGEGSLEIQVGTWWATRIGALMAIIGVVFFGVYASQYTTPLVRFMELLGISAGVTALGLWLERKVQRFGAVLFGAGLAMLYFCAFAGYAVPAVKVIAAPSTGAMAQFAAIALIIVCALWRGSPVIATMGVFLGYVACFFAFIEGLNDHALVASVMLGAGAVYFYLVKGWTVPFQISIPSHYFIYFLILVLRWGVTWSRTARSAGGGGAIADAAPDYWIAQAWLIGPMVLYGAADFMAALKERLLSPWPRRLVQTCNTACAIGLGFIVTYFFFRVHLSPYYFAFGAILLAASLLYYFVLQHNSAFLMHAYFIKGTALITLGLICALDARTRWTALAIESLVLLFSAKRSRLLVVEIFMILVWFCSFGFFTYELMRLHYLEKPPLDWNLYGYSGMTYLLLSAFFFCLQARWLAPAKFEPEREWRDRIVARNLLNVIYSLFIGVVALMVARVSLAREYFPLGTILIGVALALVTLAGRHWIPLVAAALPLIWGQAVYWNVPMLPPESLWLWINGGAVAALSAAIAAAACLYNKRRLELDRRSKAFEVPVLLAWIVSYAAFACGLLHLSMAKDGMRTMNGYTFSAMAYLLISAFFFCAQSRWLSFLAGGEEGEAKASVKGFLHVIFTLALGGAALMIARLSLQTEYYPLGTILIGAIVALVALAGRHWIPVAGAAAPLICGQAAYWIVPAMPPESRWLWINGGTVTALSLGIAAAAYLYNKRGFEAGRRNKAFEASLIAIWTISFAAFAYGLQNLCWVPNASRVMGPYIYAAMAYLLISAYFFCAQARWRLAASASDNLSAARNALEGDGDITLKDCYNFVAAVALGGVALVIARLSLRIEYFPLGTILIGVALALVTLAGRHWIPLAAAALPLVVSHLAFWRMNAPDELEHWLWINGIGAGAITLATSMILNLYQERKHGSREDGPAILTTSQTCINLLWMMTLQILFYKVFSVERQMLAGVVTALALAALCGVLPVRRLADWSALPAALAFGAACLTWAKSGMPLTQTEHSPELWMAAAGAIIFVCGFASLPYLKERIHFGKEGDDYQCAHILLAALFVFYLLLRVFGAEELLLALTAAALFFMMLARWPGLKGSVVTAIVFLASAHVVFYQILWNSAQARTGKLLLLGARKCDVIDPDGSAYCYYAIALGAATIVMPLLTRLLARGIHATERRAFEWLNGALAISLLFLLAREHSDTMHTYVTVCWGVSAFAVIFVGFLAHSKPMRLEGLAALALCIVRAFVVDIDTMLARIFAFMTLGAALLIVGFIYSRYRAAIEKWDNEA
ncbi:MAG: DUF2339 domain-containing protein [Candidatus Sumerlaeota bacterium]|nr:DUF2339 domain-containing protein [Candidatus Sumerlaeota bacterium]